MTDDELAEFDAAMDEQGKELRNALADDLGGEPAEYQGTGEPAPDGDE